jgi:hypothetical protein
MSELPESEFRINTVLSQYFNLLNIGVKIIVGTIHELSLQGFGGYAHLQHMSFK